MDATQILSLLTAFFSTIAAALAWLAKLRWSDEFAKAKDETIKAKQAFIDEYTRAKDETIKSKDSIIEAKNAQIAALQMEIENQKELNPMKLREYFESVKTQLEEYNDMLQQRVEEKKKELEQRDIQINELSTERNKESNSYQLLLRERDSLNNSVKGLELEIFNLRKATANVDNWFELEKSISISPIKSRIQSYYEEEVSGVIKHFNGQKISGRLFGIEDDVILPIMTKVIPGCARPQMSGDPTTVDFLLEGKDKNWVIDLKSLRNKTQFEAVNQVLSSASSFESQPWLIVFHEIDPRARAYAQSKGVLITGIKEFAELKKRMIPDNAQKNIEAAVI